MPLLFKTWVEFFHSKAQEDGPYKSLTEGSFDPFNAATRRHTDNRQLLFSSVLASRYNFFLFTGANKTIQMVHSIILVSPTLGEEPILVGIQGNRAVSPIRAIPTTSTIVQIRNRRGTAMVDARWKMPSMDQFLEVTSEDEFESLTAEADAIIEPETDFVDLPNHTMTHPIIFRTLGGGRRNACKGRRLQNRPSAPLDSQGS
jgi:hypothetical protein